MPGRLRLYFKKQQKSSATAGVRSEVVRPIELLQESCYQNVPVRSHHATKHPGTSQHVPHVFPAEHRNASSGTRMMQHMKVVCSTQQAADMLGLFADFETPRTPRTQPHGNFRNGEVLIFRALQPKVSRVKAYWAAPPAKERITAPSTQVAVYQVCDRCGVSYSTPIKIR
ncbi:hypothetical protein ANPL_02720 [Anaplasma platys]|uniref:Uncharacterized protein n=1 Tax=Anaplasma platys TaxID=949 RepID=A0A858PYC2_9RICK|nr:hypothetical protein [Anaplasma platys]QJC27606.1 hypothetical protein ANPL_02720 [Anaplasma platys]